MALLDRRFLRSEKVRSLAAYSTSPILGLASGPILAYSLGPAGRGEFAAVVQPITAVTGLAALGVPSAVAVFVGNGYDPRSTIRHGWGLALPASAVTYGLMIAYAFAISPRTGVPVWMFAAAWSTIPIGAALQVVRSRWQGSGSWKRLDLERLSWASLRVALIAALAVLGTHNAGAFVGAHLVAMLVAAVVLFPGLRAANQESSGSDVGRRAMRRFAVSAWPTTIFLYAGARLDQALMPAGSTTKELGLYAVAVTVAEVPMIAGTLIARDALQYRATGKTVGETFLHLKTYWIALTAGCLGIGVSAPLAVPLAFGQSFDASVSSVQVLMLGSFLGAFVLFIVACLEGGGHPRFGSVGPVVSMSVTAIGFTAWWGDVTSIKAAWITLASQGVSVLVAGSILLAISRQGSAGRRRL